MRKTIYTLISVFIFTLAVTPNIALAGSTMDQYCMLASSENYVNINRAEGFELNQSFTPSKNTLTSVKLYFNGDGKGQLFVELYKGNNYIATSRVVSEPIGYGAPAISFYEDISVIPGEGNYYIVPRLIANNSLMWYFKTGCYNAGKAYSGSTPFGSGNDDFGFITYGYDAEDVVEPPVVEDEGTAPTEPVGPAPVSGDVNLSGDPSQGVQGDVPGEAVEDIVIPQNPTGTSLSGTNVIRWEASTTENVDGYRIYRSNSKDGDFQSLGEVSGEVLVFSDSSINEDKIYYYFVRALKGEDESASSDTIGVLPYERMSFSSYTSNLWQMFSNSPLWLKVLSGLGLFLAFVATGYVIYRRIKK